MYGLTSPIFSLHRGKKKSSKILLNPWIIGFIFTHCMSPKSYFTPAACIYFASSSLHRLHYSYHFKYVKFYDIIMIAAKQMFVDVDFRISDILFEIFYCRQ